MKILMMHTSGGAIGYYRHWMPAKALEDAGHEVKYLRGETEFLDSIRRDTGISGEQWLGENSTKYDVVHMGYSNVQQHATIAAAIRNMAYEVEQKNLPIITDIDDDPINVPSYNTAFKSYTPQRDQRKNLFVQLRSSDTVTCTTDALQGVLRDEAKRIHVLPNFCNPTDWDHFDVRPEREDDRAIYIMYAGGAAHAGDLKQLDAVAPAITRKYDGKEGRPLVRWVFVGYAPSWAAPMLQDRKDPRGNRAFFIQPAQLETFWKCLRWVSPDIFIAPVEQNQFNCSKSIIKAYDAVTANAAFVCQDWETYADVPDECVFKVRGDVQWEETLSALIEDKGLAKKRAKLLREWVLDARQIKDYTDKWTDVYSEAMKTPVIKELSDIIRPRIIRPGE